MATRWPPALPAAPAFVLHDAAVPRCLLPDDLVVAVDGEGLARVDIAIERGRIRKWGQARPDCAAGPAASVANPSLARFSPFPDPTPSVDLAGCQVWPCFVDLHSHLDKGHIWPRAPNADGTFGGALAAATADRGARWNERDVEARFEFSLRAAFAHGTAAMRTHLDSIGPQHRISWPVFANLRERWQGRIDLQAVTIVLLEHLQDDFGDELADLVAAHGGILGAIISADARAPGLDRQLDRIFALAHSRGIDLDFHADENGDPQSTALCAIAEACLRSGFRGKVVVGHCCSLAAQSDADVERTLAAVAAAKLAIVSLPMCNLFLQDRTPRRTPRWRGVTLLHELRARGIAVSIASDNCRDPFYGYGDHDMLEVFREAVRIAHLDRPVGDWPNAVTRAPAQLMGLPERGRVEPGVPADLVLFNARGYSELLSRPQADRIVVRAGRPVDTTPPDYRELDPLMEAP